MLLGYDEESESIVVSHIYSTCTDHTSQHVQGVPAKGINITSLVPRLHPAFQHCTRKTGKPGISCHMIRAPAHVEEMNVGDALTT